jgi:hypothetical protein
MRKPKKIFLIDTMRESIRRYISVHRFRRLRNRILPCAEARGLFTDDDIFMNLG